AGEPATDRRPGRPGAPDGTDRRRRPGGMSHRTDGERMRRRTLLLGGAALAVTPLGCGGADGGEAPRVVVSTLPPWLDGTQVPAAGEDASGAGDDEEPAEPEEPEEP